jgi:cellulose synthase/poly-beta-1,6-N-acetylglucosamine synthase-like glycosyltransferase
MNVISYEMAPNTFAAFWKQRMRWTQGKHQPSHRTSIMTSPTLTHFTGWTQASIRHLPLIWNQPPTGKRNFTERTGIFSLLVTRELSFYLVSQHTCLLISFLITNFPHNGSELARLVFFQYPMAEWFLFTTVGALIATLYFTERVRSEFTSWTHMLWFGGLYVPYLILQSVMGLYGHARELVKYSSWNPTART